MILLLAGCGPLPKGDAARPDIVLVSIDSLRADHLSSYGYERKTTPNLDALAATGLRFTDARAASPWTLPSHMTMMTGLWPLQHQVIEDELSLSPSVPVIAEALQKAGYATAGFVSTIYVGGQYGFERGFDRYQDYDIAESNNLGHSVRVNQLVDDSLAWVKQNGSGKPVFLFVHIYDVHYPYLAPEPWDTKFDYAGPPEELKYRTYQWFKKHPLGKKRMAHQVAQYDESLAWVDDELGRMMRAWTSSRRDAYWFVTADHGEEFGERGSWGHAHTLFTEALHIPLIVAGPGIEPRVRDDRVGTIDLATTMAAMAGLAWTGSDGVDLRSPAPPRTFYAETSRFETARLSVQEGTRRLDVDLAKGKRLLYDLVEDPREKKPVQGDSAAMEATLWRQVGETWTADGPVESKGWVVRDGAVVGKSADPGAFGLYPPDARVAVGVAVAEHGVADAPSEGALRYAGPRNVRRLTVTDATKAQLEALGYVQGEEEPEAE